MVNSTALRTVTFAHSPDADDAFMFYGFACGAVKPAGLEIRHHLEDIQSLNDKAFRGVFEMTAVSAHAYAHLTDRYDVMTCGASVGRGYGPILIAREDPEHFAFRSGRIAVPGKWTTAALALDLWLSDIQARPEKIQMPFDRIMEAVEKGIVDAGVIIHEGQLYYETRGLHKIWDAGEWWGQKTRLPLPLGLDVVRKDLGEPLGRELSAALRESIVHARSHPKEAIAYALQFGRGLDEKLGERFINLYVNQDTLDQGPDVQEGLRRLYQLAGERGLLPRQPDVRFI